VCVYNLLTREADSFLESDLAGVDRRFRGSTTWRHSPEGRHLYYHRRENLKAHC